MARWDRILYNGKQYVPAEGYDALVEAATEAFGILNARMDLSDSMARHQAKSKLRRVLRGDE